MMETNYFSGNENYFESREKMNSFELTSKHDTLSNESDCEEQIRGIKVKKEFNDEEINVLKLPYKHNNSNNHSGYQKLECKTQVKNELVFNKNFQEVTYKEDILNDDFHLKEQVTGLGIKPKNDIAYIGVENSPILSNKQNLSNNDFDSEELLTNIEIKAENDADCEEKKSELTYKQDTLNNDFDFEEQITGKKMKMEEVIEYYEVDSLELTNKQNLLKNDPDFEEQITRMESDTEDDCKEKNSFDQSDKYDASDDDSDFEKKGTALKLTDIYDPSAFTSKIDMQTQSDSSDDFDEETNAILEPVVECEISENTVLLNETEKTGLEPEKKWKTEEKVINLKKSKNVMASTIKCNLCAATFKSKKRYETHLEKHSVNEKVECNMCGKAFPYNRFLRHIMVHTGEKPHVCKICNRGFRLKRDLKQHSFTHTGERPYPCKMCGKKFADSSARRKHYQTHTGEKPYTCEICQRAFTQISHLREHQVTHTREKGHTCDLCEKKFTTKSSLQRHVLTHINCCEICGETFTTSTKLERHKELHDFARPYSCPFCTRRFVKKTDVNTHVLIHSDVKDVICTICGGAFKSYRYLRVHHYHSHTGMEPPYACPVCKKGFFQEMSLQKHSAAHTPKKRVKCFECKKVFASPRVLEEHICILDRYFDCKFCDRKYRHKSDLNKHVKKFHI